VTLTATEFHRVSRDHSFVISPTWWKRVIVTFPQCRSDWTDISLTQKPSVFASRLRWSSKIILLGQKLISAFWRVQWTPERLVAKLFLLLFHSIRSKTSRKPTDANLSEIFRFDSPLVCLVENLYEQTDLFGDQLLQCWIFNLRPNLRPEKSWTGRRPARTCRKAGRPSFRLDEIMDCGL